jgi:PEP-CTERM motif
LSAAETFFSPGHSLPLGTIAAGKHSIEIEYSLTYNSGTAAASGDGFGFTYALVDPPPNVPEPSTWAMMLLGFAGLAFCGYRARVRPAPLKETQGDRRKHKGRHLKRPLSCGAAAKDCCLRAKLCPPLGDGQSAEEEGLNGRGKLMKRSIGQAMLMIALAGFATLAEAQAVSWPPPHYAVINLGTLGGSQSNGYGGVTNDGWVSGDSYLPGDTTEHAVLWRPPYTQNGAMIDLGTLGGLNSGTAWPQKNTHGLIVGTAQGSKPDPLGEYWNVADVCVTSDGHCTGYQNLEFGFRWQNGVMTELPPLCDRDKCGNSSATGDNNLGQVVGLAETGAKDPMCPTSPTNQPNQPQQLVIHAVVWGPRGEVQKQLLPLEAKGDDLSAALGINDNSDVVGLSGTCGTPIPTRWAFTPCFGETAQPPILGAWEA